MIIDRFIDVTSQQQKLAEIMFYYPLFDQSGKGGLMILKVH